MSHDAGSISPLRFSLAYDGRHRIIWTLFATVCIPRWLSHACDLSFAVVPFVLILCSNPAIAGNGSALVPILVALPVHCLSTAHETFRHLLMPALPTVLSFDRRPIAVTIIASESGFVSLHPRALVWLPVNRCACQPFFVCPLIAVPNQPIRIRINIIIMAIANKIILYIS